MRRGTRRQRSGRDQPTVPSLETRIGLADPCPFSPVDALHTSRPAGWPAPRITDSLKRAIPVPSYAITRKCLKRMGMLGRRSTTSTGSRGGFGRRAVSFTMGVRRGPSPASRVRSATAKEDSGIVPCVTAQRRNHPVPAKGRTGWLTCRCMARYAVPGTMSPGPMSPSSLGCSATWDGVAMTGRLAAGSFSRSFGLGKSSSPPC